jgi:hypothetical protein
MRSIWLIFWGLFWNSLVLASRVLRNRFFVLLLFAIYLFLNLFLIFYFFILLNLIIHFFLLKFLIDMRLILFDLAAGLKMMVFIQLLRNENNEAD